jgi:hypothetical protein
MIQFGAVALLVSELLSPRAVQMLVEQRASMGSEGVDGAASAVEVWSAGSLVLALVAFSYQLTNLLACQVRSFGVSEWLAPMSPLSVSEIIRKYPIGEGLDAFHDSFNSTRAELGMSTLWHL